MSDITPGHTPRIVPRAEHCVSRANISRNALKVLYRLNQAGYQAFLVGGGVRDLLLGRRPKDFDVATDAHPEEVRRLFRNCRLIGRRFRLAHVHFGPEVIEVATFRAMQDPGEEGEESAPAGAGMERVVDDSGRILRDNVYGTIEEDVWRRDFTANALYYNIDDFSIWDYVGGVQDIEERTLRMLGHPRQRYAEDPVRLLRAIRFAAKLEFDIHPETAGPIREMGELLLDVPPARLLDESVKLLMGGAGRPTADVLREYGLLRYLFPMTDAVLAGEGEPWERRLIEAGLENSDRRLAEDRAVTPVFLFCVLLWSPIRRRALTLAAEEAGEPGEAAPQPASLDAPLDAHALRDATFEIVARQQGRVSIPRRFAHGMSDILSLQARFEHLHGRHAMRLYEHPRFRAAWDFLLLRAAAGEPGLAEETLGWWREVQAMDPEEARTRLASGPRAPAAGKRKRRRRRGGRGRSRARSAEGAAGSGGGASPDGGGDR